MFLFSKKNILHSIIALATVVTATSCNKEFEDIGSLPTTTPPSGSTIGNIISTDTSYSFFNALVTKSGVTALNNASLRFTAFIPKNDVFRQMGITSVAAVNASFTTAQAVGIVNYAITPQLLPTDQIPTSFANLQAPTLLNPTAGTPAYNPFVSLTSFPSKRGTTAWINNIPLAAVNIAASNGVIHNTAALLAPPSATLWSRISTDPDMSFFKAAVTRGDSGQVGTARIDSLLNLAVGPNFTVFVPANAAMQGVLTAQITQGLVAQGVPLATAQAQAAALAASPAVFSNPALYPVLTAQTVKGIVVYHILGTRAYTVNFPTTSTAIPTLLNSAIPTHPGVFVAATFTGPVVTAATVKGVGNATPSNILINPAPNPAGTSDQNFTNGVLHKIDQVLLPQ